MSNRVVHLQFVAVVRQLVLENLAVHHVLVLVDDVRRAVVLGPGIAVPEQVEVLLAVGRQRPSEAQAVECLF